MSYTTRLLDSVMPRRHQIILGVIVGGLTLLSVVDAVERRSMSVAVPPAPIIIVATPTLPVMHAQGLAKGAAPLVVRSAATAAPTVAPTAAVAIVPAAVQIEPTAQLMEVGQAAAAPEPTAQRSHERASDKPAPRSAR